MSSLFYPFKSKGKEKKSGQEAERKWATSRTTGSTSDKTLLVNETDRKLVLRDKVGSAYGTTRYEIPAKDEIEVSTTAVQHSGFSMILYAIEEQGQAGIDTKLTIRSERLAECKKIVILSKGSDYKLECVERY